MCLLYETIRISQGVPQHLSWHEKRMNSAVRELWADTAPISLAEQIHVGQEFSIGVTKCKIEYGPAIQQIRFSQYEMRIIRSLKLVDCPDIDYHLKYADRSLLETLFSMREGCDDIIIVKNGLITDTSISNLAFFDGSAWYTPANPLLKGTCRNRLIAENQLTEMDIRQDDLGKFMGCKLINAMRDLQEEELVPVSNIIQGVMV
jgi:4-amino-4-deoxychorismate lyase